MLEVEGLSIHFEDRGEEQDVVRNVSFSVGDGEIVGIVGESGSGKTMTALTIAGLLKEHAIRDAGKIRRTGWNCWIRLQRRCGKSREIRSVWYFRNR